LSNLNNRKVAVIKLGSRIVNKGTSGGSGEALSILRILTTTNKNVHYFTKMLAKDPAIESATGHQILEEQPDESYTDLVIINGNVNFFGGAEDEAQIMNYRIINNFKGNIYYMYCDPELYLKQIWKSVSSKEWGSKYKEKDIHITRDDIVYIHQPYDIEPFKASIEKVIKPKSYQFFDFYKFPLLNDRLEFDYSKKIKTLGYGGTLRGGKREPKILEFCFGVEDSYVFGPITLAKFKNNKPSYGEPPVFEKAVEYSEYLNKMNEFKCSINIGDKKYNNRTLNQRIYEAVLSNCISFIDIEMDPNKRAFKNPSLRKLLYVKSKEDIIKRIKLINTLTEEQFKRIVDLQYDDCKINHEEYSIKLYSKMI